MFLEGKMYIQKENIQPSTDQTEIIRTYKNDGLKK